MEVLGFNELGCIEIIIDGVKYTVPDDPQNAHRAMIAEWEVEGNTISPYVAPEPQLARSTAMWRARAIAKVTPHGDGTLFDAVESAIDGMSDPVQRAAAREAWERGTIFDLDGQIVPVLLDALGLTDQDVLPLIAAAEALPA